MTGGYDKPLDILPFDHRRSYLADIFQWKEPLTAEQSADVTASKAVIYDGFKAAVSGDDELARRAGILVDEQFGAAILRDASARGVLTCMSTERSGQEEFDFEYGQDFARHLEAVNPTFAKVLVRYNPDGDEATNDRQIERLHRLSTYLSATHRLFMFELLVPPTSAQLEHVRGARAAYDQQVRPNLMVAAIESLQNAGVEPDVWKVEGLDRREDCEQIVATARRHGRGAVGCIVLGRGLDEHAISRWLTVAAGVHGFIGFAIGRTTWLDAVKAWRDEAISEAEAVALIARRFEEWAAIFRRALIGATK